MRKKGVSIYALVLFSILMVFPFILKGETQEDVIYGHISFVDNDATVTRLDNNVDKAVVNLPIVPGDQIDTQEKGRCEIQFDNGTVVRLDQNTRLVVSTILAPSLTSHWKLTTLKLEKGELYTISQNYNNEMFQVITPSAAINLNKRSTSTISVEESGETYVQPRSGSLQVMYGADADSLKKQKVSSGKAVVVTSENKLVPVEAKKNIEFLAWNEYINRNFKDLHYGVSKVPPVLNRYKNNALTYWAEKWSSLYGDWVYDDLLGYVWKPADEIFALSNRPFFHADFVKINGKMVVVPQQNWGWVPAHMGTWVWLKGGWTWIPGDWFHSGLTSFQSNIYFPTFDYYLDVAFGGRDLYYVYRTQGLDFWRQTYYKRYVVSRNNPDYKGIPKGVRDIIKRLDKVPVNVLKERFFTQGSSIETGRIKPLGDLNKGEKLTPIRISHARIADEANTKANNIQIKELTNLNKGSSNQGRITPINNSREVILKEQARELRDFNPDKNWAHERGLKIQYASERNAVVCPQLKLSSREVSTIQRFFLNDNRNRSFFFNHNNTNGNYTNSGSTSQRGGESFVPTNNHTGQISGGREGGGHSNKGGGQGNEK